VKPRLVVAVLVFLVPVAALVFVLHPVCVPLTADDLKTFNVPIEQRTDRDFYLKVFQRRGGQWYQCKTWISRFFFF
jgi:hypothetical protein